MNKRFKQLAYLIDMLLHYMNLDYNEVESYDGNLINDIKTYQEAFLWLWNYLRLSMVGAKFHLTKDHFIEQLNSSGSIGAFSEEFGEADHVTGNREFRNFGNLKSVARREMAVSRNQAMKNNPKVRLIKEVSPEKKRRRLIQEESEMVERITRRCIA